LVNYALPVKEFNNEGFCSQLLKSFKITSPVTYERAIKQSPEIMSHIPERVKNYLDRAGLDNINILIDYTGEKEFYYSSKFGQIDMFAFEQHFQSVV
ncbi:MAG: hypothetical protein IT247_04270, partial [Bacteroidia bacterium]|nr:hypothetical protein [Bacteroidia bacterium]